VETFLTPSEAAAFIKKLEAIDGGKEVSMVILRKGKKETIEGVKIPEVKADAANPLHNSLTIQGDQKHLAELQAKLAEAQAKLAAAQASRTTTTRSSKTDSKTDSKSVNVTINDGDFKAVEKDGETTITVHGKIDGKKVAVDKVIVDGSNGKQTYSSVGRVPSEYRGRVEKLIANTGQSDLRFEFKKEKKEDKDGDD
jgi:hypothetical protein